MRSDLLTARQGKLLLKTIKKSMKVQTSKLPEVQGKMFDWILAGFSFVHICISSAK